jgi:hypothetical protein
LKRRNIPGLVDLFEVSDPGEIRSLASDTRIDRRLDTGGLPVVTNLKGMAPKSRPPFA